MAIDINLLKSIIGDTDPLYNIYQDQGLFDEGNIVPYSEDVKWEGDPAGLAKEKERTGGYTYVDNIGPMVEPEYDTRLFVKELDKFKKPQAPLYNAPGMTSGLDENITDFTPKSKMEYYVERYGPSPGTYSPSGLYEGRSYSPIWDAPTITEKNEGLAGIIGHEARHQLLGQNPEFFQNIDPSYVIDEENAQNSYGAVGRHELLNRMLDFQANSPHHTGIYNDIYGTIHGNMPRHLSSPIADTYYDQATAFTKHMLANPEWSSQRDRALKRIAKQTSDNFQNNNANAELPQMPQASPIQMNRGAANIAGGGGGNTARNAQGQNAREATAAGTGTAQGYSQHYAKGGRTGYFFGGRVSFKNGGLASILYG